MSLLKQPLPSFRATTKGKEHSLEGQDGMFWGQLSGRGKVLCTMNLETWNLSF